MPSVDWELLLEFVEDKFTRVVLLNTETGGFTVISSFRPNEEDYVVPEKNVEINPIPESRILEEMHKFALNVSDEKIQKRLILALGRKNPLRQFRRILGFYPDLLEEWNKTRITLLSRWVLKELQNLGLPPETFSNLNELRGMARDTEMLREK